MHFIVAGTKKKTSLISAYKQHFSIKYLYLYELYIGVYLIGMYVQ